VDRALQRIAFSDVREMVYGVAVRTRREFDPDRKGSGVWAFWPTGDGASSPFRCRCHDIQRDGVCSHVIAVRLYQELRKGKVAA
jgi:hypothetical protein